MTVERAKKAMDHIYNLTLISLKYRNNIERIIEEMRMQIDGGIIFAIFSLDMETITDDVEELNAYERVLIDKLMQEWEKGHGHNGIHEAV